MLDAMLHAQTRATDYAKLELEVPAVAARALAIAAAGREAATADPLAGIDYAALTVDNVGDLVREAALTAAVRVGMTEALVDVDKHLGATAWRAFTADHDRVIAELRPRVLQAATVVTDALAAGLDAVTYLDAGKVLGAGSGAAALFHATRAAAAHLTAVRGFLRATEVPGAWVASFVALADGADADTLASAEAVFTGPGGDDRWLALYAVPGVSPALHTTEQARAVVAASSRLATVADEARQERARADAAAHARAWGLTTAGG